MASLMFDPSVDSRQKDAGGSELEHNRRSFGDQLPWTLFLQQVYRSGLSLARRQFSHLGYIVGHGANSEVYRYLINSPEDRMATTNLSSGQMLDRGTVVALKRIRPMRDNEESGVLRAAQKEIQVMAAPQLRNHEYIVKLHSVLWEDRDGKGAFWPTLVTEFCDCNLLELLNTQKLKMRTKLELYLGIGHGLGAIHAAGFVHGDIKCENVLIQHRGDEVIIPKLSDFGSSVYNNILADAVVVLAGTDPWRAPECVGEDGGRKKILAALAPAADIFCFGLLLWVMICDGTNPFRELYGLEDDWITTHRWDASHRDSHRPDWCQSSSHERLAQYQEKDLRALARATTNKSIQQLKENNQLALLAKIDLDKSLLNNPEELDFLFNWLSIALHPNPQYRLRMAYAFSETESRRIGLEIPSDDTEGGHHKMSFQNEILSAELSKGFWLNLEDLVSKELKNIRLNSGNRTREKIFNEIHALLLTWDQRELSICQKCCEFSTIDNSDHLYEPNIEEIFRIIINTDTTTHSCTNTNALGWHITSGIIPYASDMAGMAFNLFTCYADGYGVDTNIDGDAGLSWLIKAAQWGSLMCQSYAPTLYFRKHRRLPSHIPSVKWLVISVLVYGSQTAREVLQVTHPQILLATENARCMMMGTGFSLDEWQAGLEIKSWTTPQIEEILMKLAASRNFTGFGGIWAKLTNTLQNTLSILFPRNCDAYWPMVVSPSLDQILQGNDYLHAAVSNWTQPFEFCYKYLDMFPNSIDRPNHLGETPLLLACRAGRLQMVMLLVDKGANVSIPAGSNGETPLHWLALLSDSQDQIETLLARGADIDALTTDPRYYRGRYPGFPKNPRDCLRPGTPLDWAIQASNRLMVRFLLDHGADPLFGYRTRDSPIERAVLVRDTAILQLCVDAVDETPDDLNLFKAFYRNVSVTQRVILGVSEQDEIRIIETIVSSLPKLSSATDIEKKIFIPLRMAVQSLSLKMIACILDKMEEAIDRLKVEFVPGSQTVERQQWQRFGYNLAAVAIKRNDAAIVEFLIRRASERGYDILDDWLPYTVFELTTGPDNPEILDILLRHGISLNTRDNSGLLPLHSAILCGNLKVANRLVAAMTEHEFESTLGQNSFMAFPGASCPGNMMTFFGYIISHRQKYRADMKSFKWLFTLPPSATEFFDITKTNKTTALHLAAEDLPFAHNAFVHLSQRPVLEFLLNKFKGPQHVNAKNYLDSTPLHIAAFMGNCEYAELLVEAGADINALGTGGTPLDATFASPPQHFRAIEGGPTQEIVRRFVEGRNRIAVMLRKRGAKAMQEIGSKRRLGNWIPFPFGLGGSGPVVPHLMLVLSGRILVRRYGCLVQVPVYTKPGFIPGELKGPQFPVSILSSTYS